MPPQTRVCKGYAIAVLMKAVARELEESARAQSLPGAGPRRKLCGCETMNNVGLVLSGGGARAAYQVGALRALAKARPVPATHAPSATLRPASDHPWRAVRRDSRLGQHRLTESLNS